MNEKVLSNLLKRMDKHTKLHKSLRLRHSFFVPLIDCHMCQQDWSNFLTDNSSARKPASKVRKSL